MSFFFTNKSFLSPFTKFVKFILPLIISDEIEDIILSLIDEFLVFISISPLKKLSISQFGSNPLLLGKTPSFVSKFVILLVSIDCAFVSFSKISISQRYSLFNEI